MYCVAYRNELYCTELLAKQYWLSCFQPHHPCHHDLTTLPAPVRNMKGTLMKYNIEVVPLSDEGITDVDIYRDCLCTLHSQTVVEAKTNFVPNSPWSFTTWYLTTWKSAALVGSYHTCPVVFWSLLAFEQLQGLHHQWHIGCLSGVWSGTTLCRTSVQLSTPSDATHCARLKTYGLVNDSSRSILGRCRGTFTSQF